MENEQTPKEILIEKIKEFTGDWVDDDAINAYLEIMGYTGASGEDPQEIADAFQDAYNGEFESEAEFTREILEDSGYLPTGLPNWIKIDFQATWDDGLSWDYTEQNGYFFRNN